MLRAIFLQTLLFNNKERKYIQKNKRRKNVSDGRIFVCIVDFNDTHFALARRWRMHFYMWTEAAIESIATR